MGSQFCGFYVNWAFLVFVWNHSPKHDFFSCLRRRYETIYRISLNYVLVVSNEDAHDSSQAFLSCLRRRYEIIDKLVFVCVKFVFDDMFTIQSLVSSRVSEGDTRPYINDLSFFRNFNMIPPIIARVPFHMISFLLHTNSLNDDWFIQSSLITISLPDFFSCLRRRYETIYQPSLWLPWHTALIVAACLMRQWIFVLSNKWFFDLQQNYIWSY